MSSQMTLIALEEFNTQIIAAQGLSHIRTNLPLGVDNEPLKAIIPK
jgi:hypothetical protein